MKRKLAAIATVLLFLSACSANKTQEELPAPVVEVEASSDDQDSSNTPLIDENSPTETEAASSSEVQEEPIEPEIHYSESFTDEPYEIHIDQEEIVSLSLTLPCFTLDSESAADVVNQTFVDLQLNLQDYMGTTVYEEAQSRHTIAFLDGSYLASLEDGILTVTYTVTERYADDDGEITHENVYRFDTSTGERLDA